MVDFTEGSTRLVLLLADKFTEAYEVEAEDEVVAPRASVAQLESKGIPKSVNR